MNPAEGFLHLPAPTVRKLLTLAADYGFPANAGAVSPGICTNRSCDYTTEVEPDCDRGWCEACDSQTVKAALVLAEMI